MPAPYEITVNRYIPKAAFLATDDESHRYRETLTKWKQQNRTASIFDEALIKSLVLYLIWEDRLLDKRLFFDGSPTQYQCPQGYKYGFIPSEDEERKQREFDKYWEKVHRWKTDCLKIAKGMGVDVTAVTDFTALFTALDATPAKRLGVNGEVAPANA